MSEPKDPERLLADALRAQAVFAPHTSSQPADSTGPAGATGPTEELPPRYGLLSGAGADSLERERAALDNASGRRTAPVASGSVQGPGSGPVAAPDPATVRQTVPGPAPLPAHWVLLLALLLGLAAGSVIGLLTLV
ncbi:hypothetical protein QRX50_09350 [Amycolatopsis carbonis]|uniref:Uncharacterized protein n=1 Tax=Amycolatopsis carbonis TaxID=715471 RepID=A0A9Y2IJJ8_9PSEU|nr:hypothetical protein [Amycolatopsis sp. 2-15]WIX80942.1 hypothetical protein QRX50_09350 [Amycolatopsis sp. 2-15]